MEKAQAYKNAWAFPLLNFSLIAGFLLPWLFTQWNRSVNGDVAWLSICAKRLTENTSLIDGCYDTNPPLSIWIYAPPVYLSNWTNIELHYAIYTCMFALIAFAFISTACILKKWSFVSQPEKSLFLASFIAATTILSSISFAERDHMIALIIVPFALTQLSITWKIDLPKYILYPVLLIGSILLLIKPHYGIIAVMLLIHRMISSRKISLWNDMDFIFLSVCTTTYMIVLLTWYQDFLNIMLPDIVTYYLPYNNPAKTYLELKKHALLFVCFGALLPFVANRSNENNKKFILATTMFICALTSLFVFFLQMKGFFYHLLPTFAFLAPGLSLVLMTALSKFFSANLSKNILAGIMIISVFSLAYWRAPLLPEYPTHEDYKNADLTRYIRDNCAAPCSFFITHENMEIVSQTAFYIDENYTTRFPGYWFIPMLKQRLDRIDVNIKEQSLQDKKRFSLYAGEDLSKGNPNLIMVLSTPPQGTTDKPFDYFSYFKEDPEFYKKSKQYIKTEEFSTDRGFYFQNTPYGYEYILTWNVYKPFNNPEDQSTGQTENE